MRMSRTDKPRNHGAVARPLLQERPCQTKEHTTVVPQASLPQAGLPPHANHRGKGSLLVEPYRGTDAEQQIKLRERFGATLLW